MSVCQKPLRPLFWNPGYALSVYSVEQKMIYDWSMRHVECHILVHVKSVGQSHDRNLCRRSICTKHRQRCIGAYVILIRGGSRQSVYATLRKISVVPARQHKTKIDVFKFWDLHFLRYQRLPSLRMKFLNMHLSKWNLLTRSPSSVKNLRWNREG